MTRRAQTICIYGPSGSYKTSNVGRFARYVFAKTGKRTRLISGDGGGWASAQAEIDACLIEPVSLLEAENPLPAIRHLMRGEWWHKDKWTLDGLADVGAYAIEGITSISNLALRDVVNKGRKIAEDVSTPFIEGGEKFAAPARAHYGFVQSFVLDCINGFSGLPVGHVLFTAHEGRGVDPYSKENVFGPAAVGQAATSKIPPMLGDLLHFEPVVIREGGATPADPVTERYEVRAYFRPHPDAQSPAILWTAKARSQPDAVPALYERWPEGWFELTLEQGIDTYLEFLDILLAQSSSALREWMAKVEEGRAAR